MTAKAEAKRRATPYPDMGRCARLARERRGLSQRALAAKTGLRNERISAMERGENVEIEVYEIAARGLGFKHAPEMIRTGGDDLTRRLLRLWAALPDDEARRDALKRVRLSLVADEEPGATSLGESPGGRRE